MRVHIIFEPTTVCIHFKGDKRLIKQRDMLLLEQRFSTQAHWAVGKITPPRSFLFIPLNK